MKQITDLSPNRCVIFHRWRLVHYTGHTYYQQCKDCGSRTAHQDEGGHQPIDTDWVLGLKNDFIQPKPPAIHDLIERQQALLQIAHGALDEVGKIEPDYKLVNKTQQQIDELLHP